MFNQHDGEPRRTRVKVCGITCPEDALLCAELGADALGFNFYPRSARYLDPAGTSQDWMRDLPQGVRRVGVFVNAPLEEITALLRRGLIDSVQLHGDEDENFCAQIHDSGVPFAKAIRVRDASSLVAPERFRTGDLLLDAYRADAYGGTGHQLDWLLAADFAAQQGKIGRRIILSGGLNPENIAQAVARVRPFAVDVASGVELPGNPRCKNEARLRDFIAAVRTADQQAIARVNTRPV